MIYQDWDLELQGEHTRISPLTEADREPYGRLVLGELYSVIRLEERLAGLKGQRQSLRH